MKIVVTGSSGLFGSEVCRVLKNRNHEIAVFNRASFPLLEQKNLNKFLLGFDCIIHAAANTNVENCERDIYECYRDNALLTEKLSFAASMSNCKFVFISSTGVYGSSKIQKPYTEYDDVCPTTHHHKSKVYGENAVLRHNSSSLIIRIGWLFGGNHAYSKNFVARRIEEAFNSTRGIIYSNDEQFGVPTYVVDAVDMLCHLIDNDEVGIFNMVNSGSASRYDYVVEILSNINSNVEVERVGADHFNRLADVSRNEMAHAMKLEQLGYEPLPAWNESLSIYIQTELGEWIESLRKSNTNNF